MGTHYARVGGRAGQSILHRGDAQVTAREGLSFSTLQGLAGDGKIPLSQRHVRGLLPGTSVRNIRASGSQAESFLDKWSHFPSLVVGCLWVTLWGGAVKTSSSGQQRPGDAMPSGLWPTCCFARILQRHRVHAWCRQPALFDCSSGRPSPWMLERSSPT